MPCYSYIYVHEIGDATDFEWPRGEIHTGSCHAFASALVHHPALRRFTHDDLSTHVMQCFLTRPCMVLASLVQAHPNLQRFHFPRSHWPSPQKEIGSCFLVHHTSAQHPAVAHDSITTVTFSSGTLTPGVSLRTLFLVANTKSGSGLQSFSRTTHPTHAELLFQSKYPCSEEEEKGRMGASSHCLIGSKEYHNQKRLGNFIQAYCFALFFFSRFCGFYFTGALLCWELGNDTTVCIFALALL